MIHLKRLFFIKEAIVLFFYYYIFHYQFLAPKCDSARVHATSGWLDGTCRCLNWSRLIAWKYCFNSPYSHTKLSKLIILAVCEKPVNHRVCSSMVEHWNEEIWRFEVRFLLSTGKFFFNPSRDETIKILLYLKFQWLTMSPTEASVESLCVDMVDVFSISSMKQPSFTIVSRIFIHFLFSYHVRLIQMRILYAFNLLNI